MRRIHSNLAPATYAAMLVGVMLLAACGGSSGTTSGNKGSSSTPTPDAQAIIQKTKTGFAGIKDATFNIKLQSGSASSAQAVSGSGNGKLTRSPDRIQMSLSGVISGQQGTVNFIVDKSSDSAYVQTAQTNGKWLKIPAAALGTSTDIGDFNTPDATLVGEETINGTPCYHLHGTETTTVPTTTSSSTAAPSNETTTVDYWVSKTSYNPVRIVSTSQDGSSVTVDFTSVNTGAAITVPSGDQVISAP